MKAIIYSGNGGPDVLRLVDRDLPAPSPGEVRVRVAVSGVNPTDWQARSGPAHPKHFSEVTPHLDGAGTIDAVGEGVDESRVGQRVWLLMAAAGRPTGTAAEFTVVPADLAVPLPDDAGFDVGASLGVPALTAHCALTVAEDGPRRLRPGALDGQVVLAAGGAGAVGHAVIQLARWAGATVITTVSGPEKARLATAAGAHHVINYRGADPAAEIAPDGVDIVAEVALGANLALDLAVLRARGTISTYADDGGKPVEPDVLQSTLVTPARRRKPGAVSWFGPVERPPRRGRSARTTVRRPPPSASWLMRRRAPVGPDDVAIPGTPAPRRRGQRGRIPLVSAGHAAPVVDGGRAETP